MTKERQGCAVCVRNSCVLKSLFEARMAALCSLQTFSKESSTNEHCFIPRLTTRVLHVFSTENEPQRRFLVSNTCFLNAGLFAQIISEFLWMFGCFPTLTLCVFCCLITWQSTTTTVPVVQAVAQGVRLECSTSCPTRLTGSKSMTNKLFVTFNKEMVMGQNRAGSLAHHPSIV